MRIAHLDIETHPIIAAIWGPLHEPSVVWVEQPTFILSFAVSWNDESKVHTYCLPDYPGYSANKYDDSKLCKSLFDTLNSCDICVWHNGDKFDHKKINSRLAINGYSPPSPFKSIDTLKIARSKFGFDSNKLDDLGFYLGFGRKIPTVKGLHQRCGQGDLKAWDAMRRYNAQDVRLLYRCYERLKSWGNTPDLRLYHNGGCPTCLSNNVQRRGTAIARSIKYQRWQCCDCGKWFSGERINEKENKAA